jgi:hypothetical protein
VTITIGFGIWTEAEGPGEGSMANCFKFDLIDDHVAYVRFSHVTSRSQLCVRNSCSKFNKRSCCESIRHSRLPLVWTRVLMEARRHKTATPLVSDRSEPAAVLKAATVSSIR